MRSCLCLFCLGVLYLAAEIGPRAAIAETHLEAYGDGAVYIARFQDVQELQDGDSKIGLRLGNEFSRRLTVFAQLEVGVDLVSSVYNFDVSANTSSGFGKIDEKTHSPFGPRLGMVGVDFASYGRLSVGKQWSVYYDVTGWTDQFAVFGGQASGTYDPDDGGEFGTGRVDQAVAYRWGYRGFAVGMQTIVQVLNASEYDAVGVSAQYTWGFGLSLGVAYVRDKTPRNVQNLIIGAQDRAETTAAGIQYVHGPVTGAFVYSYQVGRYFADVDTVDVIGNANGAELYLGYQITKHWSAWGGFNILTPFDLAPPADPDTHLRYAVVGGGFNFDANTQVFTEMRLDDGTTPTGVSDVSVFTVGLTVAFSSSDEEH